MNSQQLVEQISKRCNLKKSECEKVLKCLEQCVKESCSKGESVRIFRFGKFHSRHSASRRCYNPQTHRFYMSKSKTKIIFTQFNSKG